MFILNISKTCLYEFYHEYMALFREKCKIMYTDSLIYYIKCDNIYDMKPDISRSDTSDYLMDSSDYPRMKHVSRE